MADNDQKTRARTVTHIGVDDSKTIYSNNVEMRISLWDFRFQFGEVLEATDDLVSVESKVVIYMSPQHAKVFANLLLENVTEYEKRIGIIPGPEGREE